MRLSPWIRTISDTADRTGDCVNFEPRIARMTRMGRTEFLSLPTALMACGPFASFAQFAAKTFAKIEETQRLLAVIVAVAAPVKSLVTEIPVPVAIPVMGMFKPAAVSV